MLPPNLNADGPQAAQEIRTAQPETAVIVLSQFLDASYALDLVSDSSKEKGRESPGLTDAVERVVAGGSALDPDVIATLVGRKRTQDPLAALTPNERAVPAVERHVTGIFMKLGLNQATSSRHRRVLAVLRCLKQ